MEDVFRALAHPARRALLDLLRDRDGQTLSELHSTMAMTRFGTMKHLAILERAGLVATRRAGRRKLHYLNPVPIRLLHDRWISRYAEPLVRALGNLKRQLEGEPMNRASLDAPARTLPRHVYEIYVRATPERIWEAITRAALTREYFYGTSIESDWKPGAPLRYRDPDGKLASDGTLLEIDPPRLLVHTFSALWNQQVSADRAHRVTWRIQPMGDACRVSMEHDDFDGETATYHAMTGGTSVILNGLKTLLETGEPLRVGAPSGHS